MITTLFTISVLGGKAKVDQTPAFAKSFAKVLRRVVIAAGISPPVMLDLNTVG